MPDAIDDIQRLMTKSGLSQVELARKIEVSPEALSRMLRDDRRYPPLPRNPRADRRGPGLQARPGPPLNPRPPAPRGGRIVPPPATDGRNRNVMVSIHLLHWQGGDVSDRDIIKRAIRALPWKSRIALLLVDADGLTAAETAAVFDEGDEAAAIEQLLTEARARVRRALAHHRRRAAGRSR